MSQLIRHRITLKGIVQGVGMRPHISTVATKYQLTGFCGNDHSSVFIEIQGTHNQLAGFESELLTTLPPLAHVISVDKQVVPVVTENEFRIVASRSAVQQVKTLIPPDATICRDCCNELFDPSNRRYLYPFINCTNCGPRLSIIMSLPYDRPTTTMKDFPMCPACEQEYRDPTDRRFHAQPISCPNCGPKLWLENRDGKLPEDPIAGAQRILNQGGIIAVRGIGGFHILCDATNPATVAELRRRKRRADKPFALMVPNLDVAEELASFSTETRKLLTSPAHPIVIAPARTTLSGIAPELDELGIMLPYSPLHLLLVDRPVVATSANFSGEPMCFQNPVARHQLLETGLVDCLLTHDREIHVPVEDSVYRATTLVRRSRGLAPVPISVPDHPCTVLAVGGELKNTFGLAIGDRVHVSSHIGDMGSFAAQQAFESSVAQLLSLHEVIPDVVACDLHPDYATTNWAQRFAVEYDLPLVQVQHHHAHALSLLAEHGLTGEKATIIVADGTGFGTDGTIWGGEILSLNHASGFTRDWHLPVFPLVGGDRAIQFPWRQALGLCHQLGIDWSPVADPAEVRLVRSQLESGIGVIPTSSLGRLFDAAASLLGLCQEVTFEAQAAMLLERCAANTPPMRRSPRSITEIITSLFDKTLSISQRARDFHNNIAALIAAQIADDVEIIGITGGCALNQLLIEDLQFHLDQPLLQHKLVPANDGGLSLGQAVAGRLLHTTKQPTDN